MSGGSEPPKNASPTTRPEIDGSFAASSSEQEERPAAMTAADRLRRLANPSHETRTQIQFENQFENRFVEIIAAATDDPIANARSEAEEHCEELIRSLMSIESSSGESRALYEQLSLVAAGILEALYRPNIGIVTKMYRGTPSAARIADAKKAENTAICRLKDDFILEIIQQRRWIPETTTVVALLKKFARSAKLRGASTTTDEKWLALVEKVLATPSARMTRLRQVPRTTLAEAIGAAMNQSNEPAAIEHWGKAIVVFEHYVERLVVACLIELPIGSARFRAALQTLFELKSRGSATPRGNRQHPADRTEPLPERISTSREQLTAFLRLMHESQKE